MTSPADSGAGLCGPPMFPDLPPSDAPDRQRAVAYPLWTEHKAQLIQRYLQYFVFVTKHGTYIDAFAGPQQASLPDSWAAKLVLESRPSWFRHFYFFEKKPSKVAALERLRAEHSTRDVNVVLGDCNVDIPEFLRKRLIPDREATFCLLDQRTFECHWSTVQALARYKPQTPEQTKVELFYFLANKWLDRALGGVRSDAGRRGIEAWWGRPDWLRLKGMDLWERARQFSERFKSELGYRSAVAHPIFTRKGGGGVMYFMIHATDHPRAPDLMSRAYAKAVSPPETVEQLELEIGGLMEPGGDLSKPR